jgi:hypothetical protein
VLTGQQGHFSETEVNPVSLPLSRSIMRIMQWCLPFLRQQAGRLTSASGANSGAISIQLKSIISATAIERRIAK